MYLVPLSLSGSRQSAARAGSLDGLFNDAFGRFFATPFASTGEGDAVRAPNLDVTETEAAYSATMDMPGVDKKDVQVCIDGRRVTVEATSQRSDEKKEGDRMLYRERSTTSYSRSFTLPLEVNQSDASAKLENGVLTLTLPKRGSTTAQRLTVL